ncbi:MAG: hypothetical protein KAT68_16360 [Bacteroidales bacterium]|nr:hypothetical protein [Bacteroidales bacterium]
MSNIILFDKNEQIVYAGIEIVNSLEKSGINLSELKFSKKTEGTVRKQLIDEIKKVRNNQIPVCFRFDNIKSDFYIFPSNLDNSDYIALSTRRKINQINKIEHDLTERVKELECLYNISHEIEVSKNPDTIINNITYHLRQGFQFPEITTVYFQIKGTKYGNGSCDSVTAARTLTENIYLNKKIIGNIKVCYNKNEKFLKEEKQLLKEISGKISRAIEKYRKTRHLEKQRKILLLKNRKLIKLTEECNERKESLRIFFNAITDIIIVIDSDMNIIMSNNETIGNVGKCYKKIFNKDDVCENCPSIYTFKKGKPRLLETKHGEKSYLLHSNPIFNNKGIVNRVLEVCHDTTKEKQMEFQLIQSNKLASLGKLVAGIAHEINNPNTFILGNIKIIKEAFTDILPILDQYYHENDELKIARLNYSLFKENIEVLMEDMENGAQRMKKIVEDLRNFAKKDDGSMEDLVEINTVIKNSLRLVSNQIKRNAELKLELSNKIPQFVGNNQKLEQVVVNMALNALQALGNKKGLIKISSEYNKIDKEIVVKISDNGIGIDNESCQYIFDPFFTTKRNYGGTGLGLSICYKIIKEHHGRIEVESKVNEGTTFKLILPVNK